jgi:hypothetical protein
MPLKDKDFIDSCKRFCVLPWIHFHAWPDGKVFPCCVADSTKPVANTSTSETVLEIMNSDRFKEIRVKMLSDEYVPECKRCYELEEYGIYSLRQGQNGRRGVKSLDLINRTRVDGSIAKFDMKYMDIRFSNFCNFKCRSCGPSCSSVWAQEHVEMHGQKSLEEHFDMKKIIISNNEENVFFSKLEHHLMEVEEVYFAGGEIIITDEHYKCLDFWIKNGKTDIELNYTSNFSTLKYKQKDLLGYWKQFKNVRIWASLDAMGEHAEIIRAGTDWNRIESNMKRIKNEAPNVKFSITPTISIWNVHAFPKFLDYLVENKFIDPDPGSYEGPRFNILTSPWWANIGILPNWAKTRLLGLYRECREKYRYNTELVNGLSSVILALEQGVSNPGGLEEFFAFNDKLDKHRKEKLLKVVPELYAIRCGEPDFS